MAPSPDLFVVCKQCQAEVSPYITECPYCGGRLRKRAPKLEKGGTPKKAGKQRTPRLGRLRSGEIPGIRGDRRPYMAMVLVMVPVVTTLLATFGAVSPDVLLLNGIRDAPALADEPWRAWTTTLYYGSTGYELVALAACFVFAWLLERRHGWWAPLLVFLIGAGGANALAATIDVAAPVWGGNAAALALLTAWVVRDALAARRGVETDTDWLLVASAAVILFALPLAFINVSPLAGLLGAAIGLLLGALLAPLARE